MITNVFFLFSNPKQKQIHYRVWMLVVVWCLFCGQMETNLISKLKFASRQNQRQAKHRLFNFCLEMFFHFRFLFQLNHATTAFLVLFISLVGWFFFSFEIKTTLRR